MNWYDSITLIWNKRKDDTGRTSSIYFIQILDIFWSNIVQKIHTTTYYNHSIKIKIQLAYLNSKSNTPNVVIGTLHAGHIILLN